MVKSLWVCILFFESCAIKDSIYLLVIGLFLMFLFHFSVWYFLKSKKLVHLFYVIDFIKTKMFPIFLHYDLMTERSIVSFLISVMIWVTYITSHNCFSISEPYDFINFPKRHNFVSLVFLILFLNFTCFDLFLYPFISSFIWFVSILFFCNLLEIGVYVTDLQLLLLM